MKKITLFLVVAGLLLSGGSLFAKQDQQEDPQKMLEMMKKIAAPVENHAYLATFAGEWQAVSKSWMQPGAPPLTSKGVAVNKMILGGRYLEMVFKGEMMGMTFEGRSLTGYDKLNKKFVSLWVDSMGTGFYLTEGSLDQSGKVRTETGLWDDPMTGGKSKVKMVYKTLGDDKFVMDMYMVDAVPGVKEFKNLEVTYTRKK